MILQALKNIYPKASEKVLIAVIKELEKCRGKNMSTEELADWIGKLVTAHTIEEALRINTEDDSKPSQFGHESSFAITEAKKYTKTICPLPKKWGSINKEKAIHD